MNRVAVYLGVDSSNHSRDNHLPLNVFNRHELHDHFQITTCVKLGAAWDYFSESHRVNASLSLSMFSHKCHVDTFMFGTVHVV